MKGLAPVFGVEPLAPVFGVDPLKKQKVRLAIGLADFLNFFGSLYGAEGGTRQANEKDSNQQAVLLDKLKEQGSYGDPVSGTLTRCAVYLF